MRLFRSNGLEKMRVEVSNSTFKRVWKVCRDWERLELLSLFVGDRVLQGGRESGKRKKGRIASEKRDNFSISFFGREKQNPLVRRPCPRTCTPSDGESRPSNSKKKRQKKIARALRRMVFESRLSPDKSMSLFFRASSVDCSSSSRFSAASSNRYFSTRRESPTLVREHTCAQGRTIATFEYLEFNIDRVK